MIAFDTNVLLRIIVCDDPDQVARVRKLVQQVKRDDEEILVTDIVLCETIWTLRTGYRHSRKDILKVLKRVINTSNLRFESGKRMKTAIESYEKGRGDFADYLLRERCVEAGCRAVATFDKALLKDEGFIEP